MINILNMVINIVTALLSKSSMSKDEVIWTIQDIHQALVNLEKGEAVPASPVATEEPGPAISLKEAFQKNKVICMECGKVMKTLTRHLKTAHGLSPAQYRKRHCIPKDQPLAAKAYTARKKQNAVEGGLAAKMAVARAAKAGKNPKAISAPEADLETSPEVTGPDTSTKKVTPKAKRKASAKGNQVNANV